MKQFIELDPLILSPNELTFIQLWKKRKNYPGLTYLSIGECIELLIATTYNLHTDYADSRFFNHILTNDESVISWDGDQLIDILFYEVRLAIQKRLRSSTLL